MVGVGSIGRLSIGQRFAGAWVRVRASVRPRQTVGCHGRTPTAPCVALTHSLTQRRSIERSGGCVASATRESDRVRILRFIKWMSHTLTFKSPPTLTIFADSRIGPPARWRTHQPPIHEGVDREARAQVLVRGEDDCELCHRSKVCGIEPHPQMTPLSLLTGFRQPR